MDYINITLSVLGVLIIPIGGAIIKLLLEFNTLKEKNTAMIDTLKEYKRELHERTILIESNKAHINKMETEHKLLESELKKDIANIQGLLVDLAKDVKTLLTSAK